MTVIQLQQPGRVYSYNLGSSYDSLGINGNTSINVILNSKITSDRLNTVEKQVTSHSEVSGNVFVEFDLTLVDLDTLFGQNRSEALSGDIIVIANNSTDDTQLGVSAVFSLGVNATEIKTYLAPEISVFDYIDSDEKCKVTFDVSVNPATGEVNDPSNQIVSLYYKYSSVDGTVYTKTLTYGVDSSFSYLGSDTVRTGKFQFWIDALTNGTKYELSFRVRNSADQISNWSINEELIPTAKSNAITNMNIETNYTGDLGSYIIDSSNVKMTYTWNEPDALTYYLNDASAAKLRIGTYEQIYDNSNNYLEDRNVNDDNTKFYEYVFNQTDLSNASVGHIFTIDQLDLTQFGVSQPDLQTSGIELYAQVLHDTHLDQDLDEKNLQGIISNQFTAYIQVYPTLQNIGVAVDLSSGVQTFTVNGTVPSQDNGGVTFTLNNGVNSIDFVDTSNSDVLIDGSVNVIQQEGIILYNDLSGNPTVTATLSQLDRNGTQKDSSTMVWSAIETFDTAKFKTPVPPTVDFRGNATDGGALRTTLLDLNNVLDNGGDAYNVEAADVRYELYNDATTNSNLLDYPYGGADFPVYIPYDYVNSEKYWLSATKHASLHSDIVNRYHTAGAVDVSANQSVQKQTARLGHYYRTTSVSLILDSIKVNVNYQDGEQTFYFAGTIDSLEASGATLTVTDGTNDIIDASAITIDISNGTFQQSVTRTYGDLSGNPTLTATISQFNFNEHAATDGNFTMLSNDPPSFITHRFKEPADASGILLKNTVGNDGKLEATSGTNYIGDMNGYEITNLTAEITGQSSDGGELADISGVFDLAKVEETIEIEAPDYLVDASYNMTLIKSFKLDDAIFTRYNDASYNVAPNQSDSVVSGNQNRVFYMGNPEITGVTNIPADNEITVTFRTHGADLTLQKTVTLVLVAKDGLEGYADGTNDGNMGSTVLTLDRNSASVTDYDTAELGNQLVTATFGVVGLTAGATSIAIVDATNSHSAIILSNFPVTRDIEGLAAMSATHNSSTH